ncbi:unnamed protein product [Lactuca virosa]|uniref:Uncharacterized protein n=1 Tax=Lactuca virosa TaxID=75947 RepID=A0AAU9PMH3_9ASTR|nr:unnamed protein product [Lactuca virosa]
MDLNIGIALWLAAGGDGCVSEEINRNKNSKVIVSLDDTIILHGGGDKKKIEERCEELRSTIENSSAMFDKEKAQQRLSKLLGGVIVCKVRSFGREKLQMSVFGNQVLSYQSSGILPINMFLEHDQAAC